MVDAGVRIQINHEPMNTRADEAASAGEHININRTAYTSNYGPQLTIPDRIHRGNAEDDEVGSLLSHTSPTSPSLVRHFTRLLKAPSRVASQRLSGMSLPSLKRLSRGTGYASVGEPGDVEMVHVDVPPVDLSTLAGLGLEAHEIGSPPPEFMSPSFADQRTAYIGAHSTAVAKPDFNELRKLLGRGLDKSIRLERKPSHLHVVQPLGDGLSREERVQRAKTVKNISQNLADERKKIVAVEAVDLSVLEGAELPRRPTAISFDDLTLTRSGMPENGPKSYFFPTDSEVPDWKPFSISSWYILSLIVLALALAGIQEYLCQWSISESRRDSGILAFNHVADVSVAQFFAWKYLPTMVTIIYSVLFAIMDFDIRRLEPYYQLSQPSGATAAASLNLDHLTMFQYFVPFKAIRLRQWSVAFSTIANILAATVAPALQNPSFNFVENGNCQPNIDCPAGQERYFVRIDLVWSRLMTTTYVVVALITMVLFVQMRRKSGLLSDPKGIAGIASMATKSHILQDFRGLDEATRGEIHKRLKHRRFVLYQSSIWQGEWESNQKEPISGDDNRMKTPHPPMLRIAAAIPFIGYMVICLIFVPLITLTKLRVIPNKAPWLPILVATILKLIWSTFEADVRLMEPFYQLSKGNARPENSLTLDYQATIYGIMPFVAAYNGHFLVATVGICSVLLDMLSVTAGSFSVSADITLSSLRGSDNDENSYNDETSVSFVASLILSIAILTFVISTTILVYVRRHHPFLPREPSTIAAVLAFIYNSHMLDDFINTERMTNKQLENKLKATGKRYALGYFLGRDNKVRCAIDEGPLWSKYKHGTSFHMAVTSGPLNSHDYL